MEWRKQGGRFGMGAHKVTDTHMQDKESNGGKGV